jgi:pyrroloquinoline quinone biosynthesis protein B
VYATARVRAGFTENNALYATLQRFDGHTTWLDLTPGVARELELAGGEPAGLSVQAVCVPGQAPLHLKSRFPEAHAEDNVGFLIRHAAEGTTLGYFPGSAGVTPELLRALSDVDCLFFDGTFWSSDELIALGLGTRRAEDMAHLPLGGPGGSLAAFGSCPVPAKYFIHINNTNPILRDDSVERRAVNAAGWQVAYDGLDLTLGKEQ